MEDATHFEAHPNTLELTSVQDVEATLSYAPSEQLHPKSSTPDQPGLDSRYDLMLRIGEGAMGEVFLAEDIDLLRTVAYKKLHTKINVNAEVLGRFIREVQITAQLEHPNIVPVYNLEKHDGAWAYAMKLVFGKTLKELLQDARAAYDRQETPDESCELNVLLDYFIKICDGMHFAHQRGVIHRDLKPANIMIGRFREVYIMDWGISRLMGKHARLEADHDRAAGENHRDGCVELSEGKDADFDETRAGKIMGTPRYLSPEQAAGKNAELTGQSDLFTLGLILYEIVCLKPAFQANEMVALLKQVLKAEKRPLEAYQNAYKIPRELQAIIHKATARRAADRYAHVGELSQDLRRYLRGQAVIAQPDTPLQAIMRWMAQHQTLAASAILTILLVLTGLTIGTLYQQQLSQRKLQAQEQQLSRFVSQVSEHAQIINNRMLSYSKYLRAIESSMRLLLTTSPQSEYYLAHDFKQAPGMQNGFPYIPTYAKKLSFDWPLLLSQKRPPNTAKLKQLSALRFQLKSLMAQSIEQPPVELEHFASQNLLPITWIHVVLSSGESLVYPGALGLSQNHDFRAQNWYQEGMKHAEAQWSKPHVDTLGQGLTLSVTLPINFNAGTADGLISLDVSFQYLIDKLLTLEIPGVVQHYLINQQGEIVLRASDKNRLYGMRYGFVTGGKAIDTPLFDQSEVVSDIQNSKSGFHLYSRNGQPLVLAYFRLNSLGWYYAVEMDKATLYRAQAKAF